MKVAHFKIQSNKAIVYQSVKVHLEETAILAEQFGAKIGLSKIGRLLGILHDSGKFSDAYQNYLIECKQYELGEISTPPRKGKIF